MQALELDYYHCTFFFPLIPHLGKDLPTAPDQPEYLYNETTASDEERAAYHYFTPILRSVLFKQTPTTTDKNELVPLQEWRLEAATIADWTLTLKKIAGEGEYVVPDKTVKFESIRLYRYFNGLQLLAFTVKSRMR